jgi:hypothetical protein
MTVQRHLMAANKHCRRLAVVNAIHSKNEPARCVIWLAAVMAAGYQPHKGCVSVQTCYQVPIFDDVQPVGGWAKLANFWTRERSSSAQISYAALNANKVNFSASPMRAGKFQNGRRRFEWN